MLKTWFLKIPAHIKLLIKLYALNICLFFIIRLVFYMVNGSGDLSTVATSEKLAAFITGVQFDICVLSWVASIPALIWSVAYFFSYSKAYTIGSSIFLILQFIYQFVMCANIPYFHQFGSHLNRNAFLWNDNPAFAAGVIFGSFSYWGYFIVYAIVAFILIKGSRKFFKTFKQQQQNLPKQKWPVALLCLVLVTGLVILGARGRVSRKSGIHEGISIVSSNNFVNQVALNPNFTFWRSVFYTKRGKAYEVPKNIDEDIAFTRTYLGINTPYERTISRIISDSNSTVKKYNFVIVVMESMSVYKMGYYHGKNLTPYLHQLNKESVFFDHFFSSGIHTFNGLFSTSTGYPSIYAERSMRSYLKKRFDGIGPLLSQQGYETNYYTTHDPHFDNMQGFFKLNGFENFISESDFNISQIESSLGVPDHVLLNRLIENTNHRKTDKPFLSVVMTASDHGPWKVPTDIPYKPNGATPQENCTLYADWSIGQFMAQAKKTSWYDNTVFIFLGDHGLSVGETYEMSLSYNHIPCIIHQPAIFKADTISSPCYQPDIPATVMGIIGAGYENKTFGINILKEQHPYVVFSADDKIGCIDNLGFFYYKTLSNNETYLRKYKDLDQTNYKNTFKGKADSMGRHMTKIYETANYFIRENYFLYE